MKTLNGFNYIREDMTVKELLDNEADDFTCALQELIIKYVGDSFYLNYSYKLPYFDMQANTNELQLKPNHELTADMETIKLEPIIYINNGNMKLDIDRALDVPDCYDFFCRNTGDIEPIFACNCNKHSKFNNDAIIEE